MRKLQLTISLLFILSFSLSSKAQQLPKGTTWTVTQNDDITVHTYMSPAKMFENSSHVIELKDQLIIVDGQFFAPYGAELKAFVTKLGKPVSRFYISHDHPDHYMGFGDAFPNVKVYALQETKESIAKNGKTLLAQRQQQFGPLMAKSLNIPSVEQKVGEETIGGIKFIFEKSKNNEAETSLIIKIPSMGIYIAQDIVYNNVHLFVSGDTKNWQKALYKILEEREYKTILAGHGKEGEKKLIMKNLEYLSFANESIKNSKSKEEYKSKVLAKYPNYSGEGLIDLYLAYYLKPKHWE